MTHSLKVQIVIILVLEWMQESMETSIDMGEILNVNMAEMKKLRKMVTDWHTKQQAMEDKIFAL